MRRRKSSTADAVRKTSPLLGKNGIGVQMLLAALPDEQRHVVALRLAGLSGPEIAAVLGRHPAAVKSTQFRAYTRLRRLLGREELS